MKIVDANIVLRYLLNDSDDLSEKAAEILENNMVFLPNEVIAEIVYVLEKLYKVERRKITSVLLELFEYGNLEVSDFGMVNEALKVYAERKLDFVDTLLYAYHKLGKHEVYTFDKKLNNLLKSKENLYE
ncbi:PIN domain-containing protein [Desulfoscipio gibsoniae]|uniref:Putative nucleic-acid-binding protein, contains PIN domain n=1 Tax=Desulfoscipio gibsoniae DSM 7213 TaxID=767817 RepID=R4KSF8_9FIRM|nr:PIN domain-containing protein [Desulfoscipio gibsoniae]AGL02516.1 putative nucleic-acid-binding protein, contains PIN domain [Desulfoscipio gibsoniae DSM 7213]